MGDVKTLRQRIRPMGICCVPWHHWRGEIRNLPITSQTLFCKNGMPLDVWEMNLKSEGYLFPDEDLLEVLKDRSNLYRKTIDTIGYEDDDFGLIPDYFTEEDFGYMGEF